MKSTFLCRELRTMRPRPRGRMVRSSLQRKPCTSTCTANEYVYGERARAQGNEHDSSTCTSTFTFTLAVHVHVLGLFPTPVIAELPASPKKKSGQQPSRCQPDSPESIAH